MFYFGSPCSASSLSTSEISESHGSPAQARLPTIPVCLCVQLLASLTFGRERGPLTRSQQEIVQEGDDLRIEIFNCWLPSCLANFCAASLLISKSDLPLDFFPRPSVYPLSSGPKNSLTSSIGLPNLANESTGHSVKFDFQINHK